MDTIKKTVKPNGGRGGWFNKEEFGEPYCGWCKGTGFIIEADGFKRDCQYCDPPKNGGMGIHPDNIRAE